MRKHTIATALLLPVLALTGCGHAYVRSEQVAINQPLDVRPTRSGTVLESNGRGSVAPPIDGWRGMAASYARRGHGAVRIEGTPADVRTASRLLQENGVLRENIIGITHRAEPGMTTKVVVSWPSYAVRLPECGDFSSDQEEFITDFYHRMSSNLGCSQQRNLGMMVSDPGDLAAPRGTQPDSVISADRGIGRTLDYSIYERPPALPTTGSTQGGR